MITNGEKMKGYKYPKHKKHHKDFYNYPHANPSQFPGTKVTKTSVGNIYKPDYGYAIKKGIEKTITAPFKGAKNLVDKTLDSLNNYENQKANSNKQQFLKTIKNKKKKHKAKLGTGARFAKLKGELGKKGAKNPAALAAWIGRRKFGSKKFGKLSAGGKHKSVSRGKKDSDDSPQNVGAQRAYKKHKVMCKHKLMRCTSCK